METRTTHFDKCKAGLSEFLMGAIVGGSLENAVISGGEINLEETFQVFVGFWGVMPLLNRYLLKEEWAEAYKNSACMLAGYYTGRILIGCCK